MEVKIIKHMNHLPKVFINKDDLNKFSMIRKYVNCSSGCVKTYVFNKKVVIEDTKQTKGIYFVPHPPILQVKFRQKVIRANEDLKKVLESLDFSTVSLKQLNVLVKWDCYSLAVFDIYYKGKLIEFPLLARQGRLSVYNVPKPKEVYRVEYEEKDGQKIPVEKLNEELFEKVREVEIYNHKIIFENEVLLYKDFYVTPGDGALVYVPENMHIRLESPDHENKEFLVLKDSWVLLSHPRPQSSKD